MLVDLPDSKIAKHEKELKLCENVFTAVLKGIYIMSVKWILKYSKNQSGSLTD